MPNILVGHSYGVENVHLTRLLSRGKRHDVKELCLSLRLHGRFEEAYTDQKNELVYASASIRKTLFALAKSHPPESTPTFLRDVAEHFLSHDQLPVETVTVRAEERSWPHMKVSRSDQPFAFQEKQSGTIVYELVSSSTRPRLQGGVKGLPIMKTGVSSTRGNIQDPHALPDDPDDRVLYLVLDAMWTYTEWTVAAEQSYPVIMEEVRSCFARQSYQSIEETLYEVGQAVLNTEPLLADVEITIRANRFELVELTPDGVRNDMEVFDSAPSSTEVYEATIRRQ